MLENIKDVNFYSCIVFMKNILYKMKVVTFDVLLQTKREFELIRKEEGDVIIKLAVNNTKTYGIDPLEFAKENRKSSRHLKGTENKESTIHGKFNEFYRSVMYKVLDRLISDLTDITKFMKEIIAPITKLHPHNITECKKSDIDKLCQVLKDADALFAEIQLLYAVVGWRAEGPFSNFTYR